MNKAVIFDLDGTLIDSLGDIHAALNDVLQFRNAPPLALATVRGLIGKGSANLVRRALTAQNLAIDEASCAAALADFLRLYSAESAKLTTIFDGAIDALDRLQDGGFCLGICTNKPLAPTKIVLDQFGLTRFFDTIVGGDQLASRKPTSIIVLVLVLQFFRNPKRETLVNENHIISPVDGKVVVIEEVFEKEYFKDKRLQVSIFMSPINVHVTRYAISGKVVFSKYHPGKYLVAWHPKSSELNERTTVVLENNTVGKILYRQIAGAVARRIVNYAKIGDKAIQGADAGFIKFGSRVDLFLPVGTKLNVAIEQVIKGGVDKIATV